MLQHPARFRGLCEHFDRVRSPLAACEIFAVAAHPEIKALFEQCWASEKKVKAEREALRTRLMSVLYMTDIQGQFEQKAEVKHANRKMQGKLDSHLNVHTGKPAQKLSAYALLKKTLFQAHLRQCDETWFTVPSAMLMESGCLVSVEDYILSPCLQVPCLLHSTSPRPLFLALFVLVLIVLK